MIDKNNTDYEDCNVIAMTDGTCEDKSSLPRSGSSERGALIFNQNNNERYIREKKASRVIGELLDAGEYIGKKYLVFERYLGEKFLPWWGERNPADLKSGDWLAVSANSLQGGRAEAVKGYDKPTGYYRWLDKYEPVATIGYSIFVYRIP